MIPPNAFECYLFDYFWFIFIGSRHCVTAGFSCVDSSPTSVIYRAINKYYECAGTYVYICTYVCITILFVWVKLNNCSTRLLLGRGVTLQFTSLKALIIFAWLRFQADKCETTEVSIVTTNIAHTPCCPRHWLRIVIGV